MCNYILKCIEKLLKKYIFFKTALILLKLTDNM